MQKNCKRYFSDNNLDFSIEISSETLSVLFPDFPRKKGEKLTCAEAFRDLLQLAVNQRLEGDEKDVSAGIIDAGITQLAERWNWHRATARNFLKKLQQTGALALDDALPNRTIIIIKGVHSSRCSSPNDGGVAHASEGAPEAVKRPPAPS